MLFLGYNPFYIKGTPEPILFNPLGILLRLPSFKSFFGLFSNITMPNTPFACFVIFNPILTPITLNHCIY